MVTKWGEIAMMESENQTNENIEVHELPCCPVFFEPESNLLIFFPTEEA